MDKTITIQNDREALEREALLRVSATNYYDLADNIDATSDDELRQIINCNGDYKKELEVQ